MESVVSVMINYTDTASPQWRVVVGHASGQDLFSTETEVEARELHRELMLRRFGFDVEMMKQLPDREN